MKSKLPQLLAVALASCALAAASYAQDAKSEQKDKGPSKADLKKYDANKDGQLDDAEKAAMKADKDAKREADKKARLEKYDTDKDGKISKEEKAAEDADKAAAKEAKKAKDEAKKAEKKN